MLYVLHGDIKEVKKNVQKHLSSLTKKRPDAEVFRVDTQNYTEDTIRELIGSQGLFEKKYIVVCDGLYEKKETRESINEFLKEMQESEHVFLCAEGEVDKRTLPTLEKHAEKVWAFTPKEKKTSTNIFTLANHLGRKDRERLWAQYLTYLDQGISAEEIIGVLFWQVKNIIIAQKTSSAKESGLSPFVYGNASAFAKKWTKEELEKISSQLVAVTSSVRSGEGDSETLLEAVLLGV